MKLKNSHNKIVKISTKESDFPIKTEASCKSKIQYAAGQKIKDKFPSDAILEDVPVDGASFYFDFWLPRRKLVFEIQGRQHDEYVKFFHKSKTDFHKAIGRDLKKEEFCRINDITLYCVSTLEELEKILEQI
jgi:hypothetical protein